MKKLLKLLPLLILTAGVAIAQSGNNQYVRLPGYEHIEARSHLAFPDIRGFKTLKCDFHIHTLYSDGMVMPEERVREAWREGLDAIAITDHNYVSTRFKDCDMNTSYNKAKNAAGALGITVIKGVEYTCAKPVGHLNFLFIADATPYEKDKIEHKAAVERAAAEGAFIIYNHPGWPDKDSKLFDFQKDFIAQKKLHAMEIFNFVEYYPVAIDYCKQYDIAPMGCSDIHGPIRQAYDIDQNPRTMTLVFARNNSPEAIKEALFARRTVAYASGILAGSADYLRDIFAGSLKITSNDSSHFIENTSAVTYYLMSLDNDMITLPAGKTIRISVKKLKLDKPYTVTNCHTGSNSRLEVVMGEIIK